MDDTISTGTKRKRGIEEIDADPGSAQKLQKLALSNGHATNGINAVPIEDLSDGAIVIDDE